MMLEVQPGGHDQYEFAPAGQSTTIGVTGAVGDYLSHLIIIVTAAASSQVQIKDGTDTAMTIFPNNPGGGIGTYPIPIGGKSKIGAWQVICGAGVSALAFGTFHT